MAKFAILLVSCLFCVTFVSGDNVPVLLFGKSLPFKVPALKTLQTTEFANLVNSQVSDETITVVFVEPKLSVEDLSHCKTNDGATCFKELQGLKERSYIPSVSDAVNGLYDNLESNKATIDADDDILDAVEQGNKVIFVYLDLATENKDFESHDKIIASTFAKLSQKYKNIVAIYTGQESSLERHIRTRRQAETEKKNKTRKGEINKGEPKLCQHFIITAESVITKTKEAETAVDLEGCTSVLENKILSVTLNPSGLVMMFKQSAGTWSLAGAKKGTDMTYPGYVYANRGFAYRCGGNFTFSNGDETIKIKNFQFLPNFEKADVAEFTKDKYVHCEGFFSPGILAGLFVVFLFLFILAIGIGFIMDINTMDKFDDPKGKTITINARLLSKKILSLLRTLDAKEYELPEVLFNTYMLQPENVLLAMLVDPNKSARQIAINSIIMARNESNSPSVLRVFRKLTRRNINRVTVNALVIN
uniref:CSON010943 protein n=1 Tax=Culicoides sonorensis TaxID=179676 RepID=A0A336M6Q9_CULSO